MNFPRTFRLMLPLIYGVALGACNIFSPLDHPSSDTQYLSAARACFDRGDLSCARENYGKLSTAYSDYTDSEGVYASLAEQDATMSALMEFVGNQANGAALTAFAERLSPKSGETRRLAIYRAFLKHTSISNPDLQAFVKFISALSLAAEILGEAAGPDRILQKTDLASSALCSAADSASCGDPANPYITTDSTADIMTNEPTGTSPNLDQLYWAIKYAYEGLNVLNAGGSFGSTGGQFSDILNTTGGTPSTNFAAIPAFRGQLVGRDGFNIGK